MKEESGFDFRIEPAELPAQIRMALEDMGATQIKHHRCWVNDAYEFAVITAREPMGQHIGDDRWHISVSGDQGVPPWFVMSEVAHHVRPGVPFAIGVPPKSWWINVHPYTLHMWEVKDENLISQWRAERGSGTSKSSGIGKRQR